MDASCVDIGMMMPDSVTRTPDALWGISATNDSCDVLNSASLASSKLPTNHCITCMTSWPNGCITCMTSWPNGCITCMTSWPNGCITCMTSWPNGCITCMTSWWNHYRMYGKLTKWLYHMYDKLMKSLSHVWQADQITGMTSCPVTVVQSFS